MRLINTHTGKFVEFVNAKDVPRYAILSHTWDKKEQTYQEVLKIQEKYGLLPAQEPQQVCPLAMVRITAAINADYGLLS